jgi:hypothetical protein
MAGKFTPLDENLNNIGLNFSLIEELLSNKTINVLMFTNSITNGASGLNILNNSGKRGIISTCKRDSFSLFLRACQYLNKRVDIMLPKSVHNQNGLDWTTINHENRKILKSSFQNKIVFYLRIYTTEEHYKEYTIFTPPSPSGNANRGLPKNKIYLNWRENRINNSVKHFRYDIYNRMINKLDINYLLNYNM